MHQLVLQGWVGVGVGNQLEMPISCESDAGPWMSNLNLAAVLHTPGARPNPTVHPQSRAPKEHWAPHVRCQLVLLPSHIYIQAAPTAPGNNGFCHEAPHVRRQLVLLSELKAVGQRRHPGVRLATQPRLHARRRGVNLCGQASGGAPRSAFCCPAAACTHACLQGGRHMSKGVPE